MREKLIEMLLKAGVHGIDQRAITIKLQNDIKADEIRKMLEDLYNRDLIQKFIQPSPKGKGGPPKTIWRATTFLADYYYR